MFLCLALAGLPTPASAQATVQETQVKAAYLAKFASYAEWPEARLGEDASPLVIGVVGADALAADLEAQTRGQAVRGHPIKVRSQRLRFEVAVPPANESRIRLSALLLTAATRVVREQR